MARTQKSIRFDDEQLERLTQLTERFNKATRSKTTNASAARTVFDLGLDRFESNIARIEATNKAR